MSATARRLVGLAILAVLAGAGFELLHRGVYGLTVFVLFPVLLGGLASWVFCPATGARAAGVGALAMLIACCSLFVLGTEGLICIAMALPLAVPLGAFGAWLVYGSAIQADNAKRGNVFVADAGQRPVGRKGSAAGVRGA